MPDTGLNPIPQTKVPISTVELVDGAVAAVNVREVDVSAVTKYSFDRITTLIPTVKEDVDATKAV
jgi:hypothetical protein